MLKRWHLPKSLVCDTGTGRDEAGFKSSFLNDSLPLGRLFPLVPPRQSRFILCHKLASQFHFPETSVLRVICAPKRSDLNRVYIEIFSAIE